MELLFKNDINCYNLIDSEDQYVREWTNNQTTDTVIRIIPTPLFPHLFYTEWDDTRYQWCGPILLIAENFARISKTR